MKAAFFILCSVLALSGCKKDEPKVADIAPVTEITVPSVAPVTSADVGFTYRGKPVDPICFRESPEDLGEVPVNLAACTGMANKSADTMTKKGLETFSNGAIGYEFKCPDGCMRAPMIAYKHLGMTDGLHVVQVESSGGGTGDFTSIGLYDLKDGKLKRRKSIAGGDRCNGGIDDASVQDGAIHYSQRITPFDLVEISGDNRAGFKAYDDIQACAVCCIGTANYVGDKLESVTLTDDPQDDNTNSEDLGPKDACFFGSYNEAYKAHPTLDETALKAFGQTFNQRCGQLAGKDLPPTIKSSPVTPTTMDQPVPANP